MIKLSINYLIITILIIASTTLYSANTISYNSNYSKTIVLKAELNTDQLFKLLSTSNGANVDFQKYIFNKSFTLTGLLKTNTGETLSIRNCRIVVSYRLWYNPNYIIVIGLFNEEYVFIKAIENTLDNKYPIGKLDEVITSELGLLTYLGVITNLNLDETYILESIEIARSLIDYEQEYIIKNYYTRPAWEENLEYIFTTNRVDQPPVFGVELPTSTNTSYSYENTTISSETRYEKTILENNYIALIYAFILATVLSLIVYFIIKTW